MFTLLNENEKNTYSDKIKFLKDNQIGLWDVCYSCKRKGSLDSNINDETPNQITDILKKHPTIDTVIFNGQKSRQYYLKYFHYLKGLKYHCLPSTSPANASMKFREKLVKWDNIIRKNENLHSSIKKYIEKYKTPKNKIVSSDRKNRIYPKIKQLKQKPGIDENFIKVVARFDKNLSSKWKIFVDNTIHWYQMDILLLHPVKGFISIHFLNEFKITEKPALHQMLSRKQKFSKMLNSYFLKISRSLLKI